MNFNEAIKMYDKAIQIDPKDALTYFNKGINSESI